MKPQWPKLKRDWVGRRVRMLRTIRNKGGSIARKGCIAIVGDYYRGLAIGATARAKRNFYITRVSTNDVELLPKN